MNLWFSLLLLHGCTIFHELLCIYLFLLTLLSSGFLLFRLCWLRDFLFHKCNELTDDKVYSKSIYN